MEHFKASSNVLLGPQSLSITSRLSVSLLVFHLLCDLFFLPLALANVNILANDKLKKNAFVIRYI